MRRSPEAALGYRSERRIIGAPFQGRNTELYNFTEYFPRSPYEARALYDAHTVGEHFEHKDFYRELCTKAS